MTFLCAEDATVLILHGVFIQAGLAVTVSDRGREKKHENMSPVFIKYDYTNMFKKYYTNNFFL